jgi:hypothetical protein
MLATEHAVGTIRLWNELDPRGFVSKGFVLEIPDLRHGSERSLNSFYESVRQFLDTLEESTAGFLGGGINGSTVTGAEALYDGSNHNLIGVRNFLSGQDRNLSEPCREARSFPCHWRDLPPFILMRRGPQPVGATGFELGNRH